MAPSEAQKKAANKYNLEHMAVLGCKVKKAEAETFKDYCTRQDKTSNTVLKEFVMKCIQVECGPDGTGDLHANVRALCRVHYQRLQDAIRAVGPLDREAKLKLVHILAEEETAGADAVNKTLGI